MKKCIKLLSAIFFGFVLFGGAFAINVKTGEVDLFVTPSHMIAINYSGDLQKKPYTVTCFLNQEETDSAAVGRLIITYSPYKTGLVIKQRDLIVYGNMGRGPIVQISNVYPMTKGLFGDPDSIEFVLKEHQLPGSDVKYYNMEIGCVYQ